LSFFRALSIGGVVASISSTTVGLTSLATIWLLAAGWEDSELTKPLQLPAVRRQRTLTSLLLFDLQASSLSSALFLYPLSTVSIQNFLDMGAHTQSFWQSQPLDHIYQKSCLARYTSWPVLQLVILEKADYSVWQPLTSLLVCVSSGYVMTEHTQAVWTFHSKDEPHRQVLLSSAVQFQWAERIFVLHMV